MVFTALAFPIAADAEALGGAVTLEPVEQAGHRSSFDRLDVIDRAERFLLERTAEGAT